MDKEYYYVNAKILDVNLGYDDVGGSVGQNFTLKIRTTAHTSDLTFNPIMIPTILKTFNVVDLNSLEGEYCQILSDSQLKVGDSIKDIRAIRPILSTDESDWIIHEYGIYYGSEMITNNNILYKSIENLLKDKQHKSKDVFVKALEAWASQLKPENNYELDKDSTCLFGACEYYKYHEYVDGIRVIHCSYPDSCINEECVDDENE